MQFGLHSWSMRSDPTRIVIRLISGNAEKKRRRLETAELEKVTSFKCLDYEIHELVTGFETLNTYVCQVVLQFCPHIQKNPVDAVFFHPSDLL